MKREDKDKNKDSGGEEEEDKEDEEEEGEEGEDEEEEGEGKREDLAANSPLPVTSVYQTEKNPSKKTNVILLPSTRRKKISQLRSLLHD